MDNIPGTIRIYITEVKEYYLLQCSITNAAPDLLNWIRFWRKYENNKKFTIVYKRREYDQ
jgi:hypothetical protein